MKLYAVLWVDYDIYGFYGIYDSREVAEKRLETVRKAASEGDRECIKVHEWVLNEDVTNGF